MKTDAILNKLRPLRERLAASLNRHSIRTVLIAGFAAVIVSGMVTVLLTQWTGYISDRAMDRFLNVDNKIADLCLKSKTEMTNARRYEKDFLLSYKEFGFNEATSRYISRARASLEGIKGFMKEVSLLTKDPEVSRQTREVDDNIDRYKEDLLRMVERYGALGSFNAGLEGEMRGKAHEIEDILIEQGNNLLIKDLLSMRRREKDFIMRNRDVDASEFLKAADLFKGDLAASGISGNLKNEVKRLALEYGTLFEQYVQSIEESRAIKRSIFLSSQAIEPLLEKLYSGSLAKVAAEREGMEKTGRLLWPMKLAAGLLTFIFSLIVSGYVSRSISSSVKEVEVFAEEISSGNLKNRLSPKGENEFAVLAEDLNRMAESLQSADIAQKKWMKEIEEISRFPDENIYPVIRVGKDGTVLYSNKPGLPILEAWGCGVRQRLPDQWQNFSAYAFNSGGAKDAEFETKGHIYSMTFVPLPEAGYLNIYSHDITASKLFEAEMGRSEERFRQLVGNIPEVFWMMDGKLENILYVSPGYEKIWGREVKSIYANPAEWLDAVHPDDRERVSLSFSNMPLTGFDEKFRVIRPDGAVRWVHSRGFPVRDKNGDIYRWAGVAQDITEHREAEERLFLAANVFESSTEGIVITDPENKIVSVNPAFTRITGFSPEEVIGKDPKVTASGRHDSKFFEGMWTSISETGQWQGEIWDRRKNGEIYPKWLSISTVKNDKGEALNYIGIFVDITKRKEAVEKLDFMAHFDILTGLPNRILLNDRTEQAIAISRRSDSKTGILFLDLDHFKNINDSLGHKIGDMLLQAAAERLKGLLRESDTVARIGGDEFVILLPDIRGLEDSAEVAHKIMDVMKEAFLANDHTLHITASVGISLYPDDGEDYDVLLKNADTAMYKAKEVGRNNYQFFTQEMNDRVFERLSMENNLRRAIERQEFVLYYQAQIDIKTGLVIGIEALIRWQHPDMGLVVPSRFIHIAEDSGLIVPIGEWVLRTACRENKEWQKMGLPAVPMAVNLSAIQFRETNFMSIVERAVKDAGLDPRYLELELTERAVMQDVESAIVIMKEMKGMGLKLTIDDFGTGYSSLSYLKRFPIDKLKIDQSFVRDITTDPNDAAITLAVISMAHSLGLRVIAEGVETEEQLAFLREHECDEIQGYYFEKPLPASEFEVFLKRR